MWSILWPRSLLLWASASASFASAYSVLIPPGVSSKIPSCSRDCVKAFLEAQWPEEACSATPSLACLCARRSTSSYTIGEAAVQCIIAANRVDICPDTVLAADTINNAYLMCDGVPNALPNTHETLSATIVIPSAGSGVIIIGTPSATATTTHSTTLTTTTTISSTPQPTTASASTKSSTFATTTFTSTTRSLTASTTISSTSTANATGLPAAEQSGDNSPAITLENGQIIGISIGIAGAIALALIAIFLARRTRRRNFPDLDGNHFAPEKEQGKTKVVDRVSRVFHISPPIFRFSRPLNAQQSYNGYQNIDRSTIGVAISRPRSTATARLSKQRPAADHDMRALAKETTPQRPSPQMADEEKRPAKAPVERPTSKLLPAKPTLTLAIPPAAATRTTSSQPPLTDRTSTLTNNTAFADLDSAAVEGTVWRPPPSDPQSATALYVADRWGNWVLSSNNSGGGGAAGPSMPPMPNPTEPNNYAIPAGPQPKPTNASTRSNVQGTSQNLPTRPPPAFLLVDPASNTAIRTSSVYSQVSAVRPPARPYPPASRSNSSSNKGSKGRNVRSNSEVSNDSATTIDTEFETSFDEERDVALQDGHLSNLSPVVERRSPSPMTPVPGRSPPRNPPVQDRLGGATVRLVPPPRRPDYGMSSPPAPMRSPGFYAAPRPGPGPVPDTPGAYPAPLRPQRTQSRPGERTRLSPKMQQDPRGLQQSRPEQVRYPQRLPMQPPQPPRLDTRLDDPGRYHLAPESAQQQQMRSPHSAVTVSSTASSLLAKRVGNDKAAALALDPNAGSRKRTQQPWRRQDTDGSGQRAYFLSPEEALASPLGTGMLPMTPGWRPRLTPTRRGDDLYLNVQ
ncbi:uncharacterized protein B0I36DRAFT_151874 [Microdochium trichocladiopsis]|uniref:Extracellular membrane protein CFEM domain-containing protein n=1 Tax=Microdochium trichocladiopsis TaxID=1682393 RepID=A0A9P8XZY8_9PEZI|nr:uncharacterized protein B0I36DRAFT_151874 [Microdochium trichocladiopsis]KAH7025971.1 hypothetical protein B0I36DRAFT_151874 [Microdochium trichocladiopsis]